MAQEVVYGFLSTNLIFLTFPKICKDTNHVNQDEVVLHKSALSWMCFNCLELLCISGACLGKEILSPRKQPQCPGALSAVDAFIWALPNNADLLPYCHAALWLLSSVILWHVFQHFTSSWKPAFAIRFQWLHPRIHSISVFPLHSSMGHEGNPSITMGPGSF